MKPEKMPNLDASTEEGGAVKAQEIIIRKIEAFDGIKENINNLLPRLVGIGSDLRHLRGLLEKAKGELEELKSQESFDDNLAISAAQYGAHIEELNSSINCLEAERDRLNILLEAFYQINDEFNEKLMQGRTDIEN
jgi:hypothetical protein